MKDGKVLLRLFNSEGDERLQKVTIDMPLSGVEEVDLNGGSYWYKRTTRYNIFNHGPIVSNKELNLSLLHI